MLLRASRFRFAPWVTVTVVLSTCTIGEMLSGTVTKRESSETPPLLPSPPHPTTKNILIVSSAISLFIFVIFIIFFTLFFYFKIYSSYPQ